MARKHWHILHENGALTMARRVPVRFDLGVVTRLDGGCKHRIARQVRQDVWRALRDVRGFAPAVKVEDCDGGLKVTAGGQVDGVFPKRAAEAQITDVLESTANKARWARWAS